MPLSPGSALGPYRVLGPLGAGGMGEVYCARDTRLGREVAIKVLPADHLKDDARRRRFLQEARSASALNHPHIVTIHEIESSEGVDFLVMEYLPGRTLDRLIPQGGMAVREVLRLAIPIADALSAAATSVPLPGSRPSRVAWSLTGCRFPAGSITSMRAARDRPSPSSTRRRAGSSGSSTSPANRRSGPAGSPCRPTGVRSSTPSGRRDRRHHARRELRVTVSSMMLNGTWWAGRETRPVRGLTVLPQREADHCDSRSITTISRCVMSRVMRGLSSRSRAVIPGHSVPTPLQSATTSRRPDGTSKRTSQRLFAFP